MNYRRIVFTATLFCLMFQYAFAQSNYVAHTLKAGESLSALAKEYNTSVGDIMRLNGMHTDTKLVYGSQIKIPSTKKQNVAVKKIISNPAPVVIQPSAAASNEVTHIVTKGETLYSIGKKYNVSVEQLKAWNHLTDNSAKLGTLLVINESGYNKFAATSIMQPKPETVAASQKKYDTLIATPQKQEPVVAAPQVNNQPVENNNEPVVVNDNTSKVPAAQPQVQSNSNNNNVATNTDVVTYSGEGFFASQFNQKKAKDLQNVSGISKTFKTASGWSDGKFYILANDIEPGTIVKLTADNGKAVYAKVLWNMGDMKENAGINFRVSNATAAALHEDALSFNLNLSF